MATASSVICHNRDPSPSSALIDKVCAENKLNRGRVKCCVVCCMHRSTKFLLRKVNSDHLKNRRVDLRNYGYEAFYCILSAVQLREAECEMHAVSTDTVLGSSSANIQHCPHLFQLTTETMLPTDSPKNILSSKSPTLNTYSSYSLLTALKFNSKLLTSSKLW